MNQNITISNDVQSQTVESIQVWLVTQFAERLEIDPEDIDSCEPFDNYGLNSAETMILLGKLERWLGQKLNPTLIFNYPTIAELAQRLGEETTVSK
ncbi:acyl carrier protein [Nostoc sp. CHAB 5834]|nr:acyl carrier protein [Nostoc sp. CHAB 5834]